MNPDPFESVLLQPRTNVSPTREDPNDPFAAVLLSPTQKEQPKHLPFGAGLAEYKKEGEEPELTRHAARTLSRVGETIAGIPGDVGDLVQAGVFRGLEGIFGHKTSSQSKAEAKKYRPPTSMELQEVSEQATGGYTKAQSEGERYSDEIAQTFASLWGPMKARRALGLAAAATSAKEGTKLLGFGNGPQEAAKFGTLFLGSLFNPGAAKKYYDQLFDKADAIAKGASINATGLKQNLASMIKELEHGVSTSEKNPVIKAAQQLMDKISGDKIPVKELTAAKRDVNSIIKDPETLKGARKKLLELGSYIDRGLKPFESARPEFSAVYRPANEMFGAIAQGQRAKHFVNKILGGKSYVAAILGEAAFGHPELIAPTVGIVAASKGLAKSSDFLSQLVKSKELQKFYTRAAVAALKEDAPALRLYESKISEYMDQNSESSR